METIVHEELEEKLKKAEDELKWKIEQFNTSKSEWEIEKKSMLQEINKLNESLDVECSTTHPDEDGVANLRRSLHVKEMECKDLENKVKKLEAENQDLLGHTSKVVTPNSSWVKLRKKFRNLEQTHRDCSASFKVKESEWNSQAKKMTNELNRCSSSMHIRDRVIEQLRNELEDCHSSLTQLKMENEELCLMLELMKPENSDGDALEQLSKDTTFARERFLLEMELVDANNVIRDLEFELLEWKMLAENMRDELEVVLAERRELELSLLDQTELEDILKQDVEDKNQRISNLQQQIVLMDEEIMIREENNSQENETSSLIRWNAEENEDEEMEYDDDDDEDGDKHERGLLTEELEFKSKGMENVEGMALKVRVVSTLDDDDYGETYSSKESVVRVNSSINMDESFIEDIRSPFQVPN